MPDTLTLAIDQGTHATRAVVFDNSGRMLALSSAAVSLQVLSRSEVEQSAEQILASVNSVMEDVLKHPAIDAHRIRYAGLATQRSSVLAWNHRNGRALSPVISWQDTRTADALQPLEVEAAEIRQRTGLRLSPHYGAGKLRWLMRHAAEVSAAQTEGTLVMGPLAAYLLHHLVEGNRETVDHANASRTLLWNLNQRDWDEWLLQLFAIPRNVLPDCRPICADYGNTRAGKIPLTAVNGDQTAALYAQGMPSGTTIRVNIGTGAFVLLPTGETRRDHPDLAAGISRSDARAADYYLEGTINGAGAAMAWAEAHFGVADWQVHLPDWLDDINDPPVFLNTIGGLGAPWWKPGPEPAFVSDDEATAVGPAEGMVAVIESIAFLIQANIALLRKLNPRIDRVMISGGLAQLDGLCRKLASLSGLTIERADTSEATARGIAWLASGCPDSWKSSGLNDRFDPCEDRALERRYAQFIAALKSTG